MLFLSGRSNVFEESMIATDMKLVLPLTLIYTAMVSLLNMASKISETRIPLNKMCLQGFDPLIFMTR